MSTYVDRSKWMTCCYKKDQVIASNKRRAILLHDNRQPNFTIVKDALLQLQWESLSYPTYPPDVASFDYHLFRWMQYGLASTRFRNAEEVRRWFENSIVAKPELVQSDGKNFDWFHSLNKLCKNDPDKFKHLIMFDALSESRYR